MEGERIKVMAELQFEAKLTIDGEVVAETELKVEDGLAYIVCEMLQKGIELSKRNLDAILRKYVEDNPPPPPP